MPTLTADQLTPGDLIMVDQPECNARIAEISTRIRFRERLPALGPQQEPACLLMLILEFPAGVWHRSRDHVFIHPSQKVRVP